MILLIETRIPILLLWVVIVDDEGNTRELAHASAYDALLN